jgi:hypothetical protein
MPTLKEAVKDVIHCLFDDNKERIIHHNTEHEDTIAA